VRAAPFAAGDPGVVGVVGEPSSSPAGRAGGSTRNSGSSNSAVVRMIALVALDMLALRFGSESRRGFEACRPTASSTTTGPGRLVAGRTR
jgi:hypothetical protein